jgi:hypothetical protein
MMQPFKASIVKLLAMLCLAALPWAAQADVWGYVDAKGVAHFANERVDERYELFFRGGEAFDTANGVNTREARAEFARPVAVPGTVGKLMTYFDLSPSFKAVRYHIREAANTNHIDFELLQALIATESGFDADVVSPKGAVGLMQLMPATAQRYGVASDKKTPVEINIRAGSRYLSDLINMFPGKLELALAAYNAGEGAVQRAGNKIPNFKETQNYVKTVMQLYTMLKPTSTADPRSAPSRVRMEMTGHPASDGSGVSRSTPMGGAVGRGNMVSPLMAPVPIAAGPVPPELKLARD